MWNFYIKQNLFFYIFSVYCISELLTIKTTTQNIRQRVALLKKQIKEEIKAQLGEHLLPIEENSSFEFNEYENDNGLITPVMYTPKKLTIKKTTTVKTTAESTTTTLANASTPISQGQTKKRKKLRSYKNSNQTTPNMLKSPEIFYRRFLDEASMNTEVQWAHCQDMITPFLTGVKTDLTHPKHLPARHPIVQRFIQLLSINTTSYTKEDIYSILYQISNLQLRLFQWDVPAVNTLLNILMNEKRHTFSNLKHGIRTHFEEWRLDISNVTNLLRQARIFRPPCVRISESTGSTKSNKASKYPKRTTPTTTCESEEDFECKYRRH